jgi:hypothetical protein
VAKINKPIWQPHVHTHEGAKAFRVNPEAALRRSVMACMLWEDQFYEDGQSIADRINENIPLVDADVVGKIAVDARSRMHLRHAPLWLCCGLAKIGKLKKDLLATVIQRPDEIAETLAMWWKDGKKPIPNQMKKGLGLAFKKFNEYSLAKYDRDAAVKMRDVLRLVRPKPSDQVQSVLFNKVKNRTLQTPDTWEVALSAGGDKKTTWTRLLRERKLGAMALLRNLRNMEQAGVDRALIKDALKICNPERVLPFRFISAARAVPGYEPELEELMFTCLNGSRKLLGKTALVVDNSGSMYGAKVSAKSDIDRSDAACALSMLVREICDDTMVISYSDVPVIAPPRRGFALRDAIKNATQHGGTNTEHAIKMANRYGYDRIIHVTDEQANMGAVARSFSPLDGTKAYTINVASYKNGIGYGPWTHIDGWSEAIIDYIRTAEYGEHDVPVTASDD